jgi:hypothetical protein
MKITGIDYFLNIKKNHLGIEDVDATFEEIRKYPPQISEIFLEGWTSITYVTGDKYRLYDIRNHNFKDIKRGDFEKLFYRIEVFEMGVLGDSKTFWQIRESGENIYGDSNEAILKQFRELIKYVQL